MVRGWRVQITIITEYPPAPYNVTHIQKQGQDTNRAVYRHFQLVNLCVGLDHDALLQTPLVQGKGRYKDVAK